MLRLAGCEVYGPGEGTEGKSEESELDLSFGIQ